MNTCRAENGLTDHEVLGEYIDIIFGAFNKSFWNLFIMGHYLNACLAPQYLKIRM